MRLRLREQFHQRKQQSTLARGRSGDPGRRNSQCLAERFYRMLAARPAESGLEPDIRWLRPPFQKKFKKNVLTPKAGIWDHAPLAPK